MKSCTKSKIVTILGFFLIPFFVSATTVTVSPLLIDRSVSERDILSETIRLKNPTSVPIRVFASVHEIELDGAGEIKSFLPPSMSDRTTSVTSWLEISRGRIELAPGEEKEIPLTIRISPEVKPGQYHAYIGFAHASNRDEAEAKVISGQGSGVIVRVGIDEKRSEFMRLSRFIVDRFITNTADEQIEFAVTNTGESPLTPRGDVLFYDTKGNEVGSVPVNTAGQTVAPGETKTFLEPLALNKAVGRFKAYLNLEYGEKMQAGLYDTVFFYIVPLPYLIGVFLVVLLLMIVVMLVARRYNRHDLSEEHGAPVALYVREGQFRDEQPHDINLRKQ